MTAHTRLLNGGPAAVAVCEDCDFHEDWGRTQDAQNAAREHNARVHAYPEQTLGITEGDA